MIAKYKYGLIHTLHLAVNIGLPKIISLIYYKTPLFICGNSKSL